MANPVSDEVGYQLIQELSILSQGRSPILQPQAWVHNLDRTSRSIIPLSTDGIDVSSAIRAMVGVRLNKVPGEYRGWLKVHAASAGVPYGVNFFGTGVGGLTISGASSSVIQTIIDNILADFVANFTWGSAAQVTDEDIIEWIFDGRAYPEHMPPYDPPDLFIGAGTLIDEIVSNASGLAGTGFASMVAEATSCTWRLWGIPLGREEYELISNSWTTSASPFGVKDVCCSGYTRLFVEVVSADGSVLPFVGPCERDDLSEQLISTAATSWDLAETELYTFDNANFGRLRPNPYYGATLQGAKAPPIRNDDNITVSSSFATMLLPANPDRTGFMVQNQGSNDMWCRWRPSRSTNNWQPTVGTRGWKLKPDEVRIGDSVPGDNLYAIADTSSVQAYIEEW